jgi:hypothetical protein
VCKSEKLADSLGVFGGISSEISVNIMVNVSNRLSDAELFSVSVAGSVTEFAVVSVSVSTGDGLSAKIISTHDR